MLEKETKELKKSDELKLKVVMICRFTHVKFELINGNIISYKNTNIAYVKPHILKVNKNDYLILKDLNDVYINGYQKRLSSKI